MAGGLLSESALARLNARGRSAGAYILYANECVRDSLRIIGENRRLAGSLVRFSLSSVAVIVGFLAVLCVPGRANDFLGLVAWTTGASVLLLLWLLLHLGLICDGRGGVREHLGPANRMTILRFFLVPPVVLLIHGGMLKAALLLYSIAALTDIADGVAARHRDERTPFGALMDPLADILLTGGVFAVFVANDWIPRWVFAILLVRYASVLVGSVVLFFTVGPFEVRATMAGKVVGVLQAVAIVSIILLLIRGEPWKESVGAALFPLLGMMFGSVIISQLIIGAERIRRGIVDVGSRGKPESF